MLWNDRVTVTATMNRDVGQTPYDLALYNETTGQLRAWCTSGTSCVTSEWFNNIGLNEEPQPQNYRARLVRSGEPDGSVSDVLTVDIRRRLFAIHMSVGAYNNGVRNAVATHEADDLPDAMRIVYRKQNGDLHWACQFGEDQCAFPLREGTAYRAQVEDAFGYVYGRTPLYTIGPDDPEALTGSDIDLGELAEMLRPVGATGICDWLLAHNELGTHVAEASVSDQYLACDAAVAAGKAVLGTLMAIAAAEHSDDVLWFLYHQGLEEQTETPPQDPDYPVPDPVRVPPVLPGTFDVYDLTDALLERSHVLTSSEAISIARTCLWLVSRAHLNGKHRCRTLPIFASGADVPEATQHDLEALASQGGAQWVQLNYEGPNKPGDGWQRNRCDPQPIRPAQQCDEYPFFATLQGGANAVPTPHLKAIDRVQNGSQGGSYGNFVTGCGLTNGDLFLGIPIHPSLGITTKRIC